MRNIKQTVFVILFAVIPTFINCQHRNILDVYKEDLLAFIRGETHFILYDPDPNPFSHSTTLSLDLLEPMPVKLWVTNNLGQTIRILINRELVEGYHRIVFNGQGLASGVYTFHLQAEDRVQIRIATKIN